MLIISFPPGSVGVRIPKMLELFKYGHEYFVESDCYIRTQIATVRLIKRTDEDQISCKYMKRSQKIKAEFLFHSLTCPKSTFLPICAPSCWTSAPTDLLTWVRAPIQLLVKLLLPFSTSEPLTFAVANGTFRGSRENSAGSYI